jgi:predicted MPP superfamily phosphohydrolase
MVGIDDPSMNEPFSEHGTAKEAISTSLEGIIEENPYKILLAHRPELFSLYSTFGIDLTLSGHVHGGQIRLPFIGGLSAPNQGFFPKYTSGTYESNHSVMVVNRGLGNSVIPQRLWNRPEVIALTLSSRK